MIDQATIQTLLEEADRVAEKAIAFGPCDDIRPVDVRHALDDSWRFSRISRNLSRSGGHSIGPQPECCCTAVTQTTRAFYLFEENTVMSNVVRLNRTHSPAVRPTGTDAVTDAVVPMELLQQLKVLSKRLVNEMEALSDVLVEERDAASKDDAC